MINGTSENAAGMTLLDYLRSAGYQENQIVVEQNLRIVPREEWGQTKIEEQDVIEILHFVGGG